MKFKIVYSGVAAAAIAVTGAACGTSSSGSGGQTGSGGSSGPITASCATGSNGSTQTIRYTLTDHQAATLLHVYMKITDQGAVVLSRPVWAPNGEQLMTAGQSVTGYVSYQTLGGPTLTPDQWNSTQCSVTAVTQ